MTVDTAYRMQLSQTLELACLSPSLSRCGDAISGTDHGEAAGSVGVEVIIGESVDSGCILEFRRSASMRQKTHGRVRTSEEFEALGGGARPNRISVQRGLVQISDQLVEYSSVEVDVLGLRGAQYIL